MQSVTTIDGHDINLNDKFEFVVNGPLYAKPVSFDSLNEARRSIASQLEVAAKVRKAASRLALEAYNEEGQPVTVKGLHAGTGRLLGSDTGIYPKTDAVRDLLAVYNAERRRQNGRRRLLSEIKVGHEFTYGKIDPLRYDFFIEKLVAEFNKKIERASTLAEEVAKIV